MLSLSGTRIISTVFTNDKAEPAFRSYTLPNTPFYFRVRWENDLIKQFYSEFEIVWDFGDGTTTTGVTAEHFYKWPGTYAVRAVITDVKGDPNYIFLESELLVENPIPDIVTFDNIYNEPNVIFTVPAGRRTPPLKVYRFSSWQNDKILKEKNYTINFFASGGKSNYMGVSSYYDSKWSHLKPYFGFVEYTISRNNYIQQKIVESTITTNTNLYAEKYLDLNSEDRWGVKLRFYQYPKEGTIFCGTSGEIPSNKTIHFVDQKACDVNDQKDVIFLYAYPDTKQITDKDSLDYEFEMSDFPNGVVNYPWNTQVVKTTFNPASGLRITSNGIGVEGPNVSLGPLTGQFLYSFDIFPTKWSGTKIPFVITYKDSDNYTTKTYPQIISHSSSTGLPEEVNTLKIFLMEYGDPNPFEFTNTPVVRPVKNSDYVILKSEEAPVFENGCYYAGVLSANREIKVACLSAFALIQDINQPITFPGYAYIMQQGTRAVRRFERRLVFDHRNEEKLNITFSEIVKTFFSAGTGGTTITYAPLRTFDVDTKDYVWVTDADTDKIFVFDQDGEPINNRFGGALRRTRVNFIDTESFTLKRSNSVAPITVKGRGEKNAEKRSSSPCQIAINSIGDAWVTLYDTISTFKFDKDDFYARALAIPNLSRKDQIFLNELDPILNASYNEYTTNFNLFTDEFSINPTTLDVAKYRLFSALNLAYSGVQSFYEIILQGDLPPNSKIQVPVTEPRGQTTTSRQALQAIFENKRHELQQRTVNYVNSTYYSILSSPTLSAKCFRDSGYIIDSIAADIANNANHRSIEVGQVYFSGPVLLDSDKTGSTVPTLPVDQVYATAESITAIGPTMAGLLPYDFWDSSERFMLSGFNVISNIILDKNNTPRTFPGAPAPTNNFNIAANEILRHKTYIQQKTIEFVKTYFPIALYSSIPGGSEALSAKCFRDTGFIVDSIAADLTNNANHRSIETGLFYLSGAVLNSTFTNSVIPTLPQNQVKATVAAISAIGSFITGLIIPATYTQNLDGVLSASTFFTPTQNKLIRNVDIFKNVINDIENVPNTEPGGIVLDGSFKNASDRLKLYRTALQQQVVDYVLYYNPDSLTGSTPEETTSLQTKCFRDTGFIIDSIAADLANNTNHRSIETGVFYFSGALLARTLNPDTPIPTLPTNQVQATITAISALGLYITGENIPSTPTPFTTTGILSTEDTVARKDDASERIQNIIFPLQNNGRTQNYSPSGIPVPRDVELSNIILQNKNTIQDSVSSYVLKREYLIQSNNTLSTTVRAFDNFTTVISNSANIPKTSPNGVPSPLDIVSADLILQRRTEIQNYIIEYVNTNYPFALSANSTSETNSLSTKCFRDTGFIIDSIVADLINGANHRSIETGVFYFSGAVLSRQSNSSTYVPTLPFNQINATISAITAIGAYINTFNVNSKVNVLIGTMVKPLQTSGTEIDNYTPPGVTTQFNLDAATQIIQHKNTIQRLVASYVLDNEYLTFNSVTSAQLTQKCNRDVGYMLDAVINDLIYGVDAKSIQYAVAYWDGSSSRLTDVVPFQIPKTLDTIRYLKAVTIDVLNQEYAKKCRRDVGFMVDAIAHSLRTGVNAKTVQYAVAYWDGSTSRLPEQEIPNQKVNTIDTINYLKSILLDIAVNTSTENFAIKKVNSLIRTIAYPIANRGASLAYDPPGIPPANNTEFNKRRNIQRLLQTNRQKIQDRVADYVVINGYFNSVTASPIIQNKFNIFKSVIIDQNNTPPTIPGLAVPDGTYNAAAQTILENKSKIQQRVVEFVKFNYPFALANSDTLSAKCFRDTGYIIDSIAADILNNANHRSIETGVFYFSGALLARALNPNSTVPVLPEDQVEATIESIKAVGKFITGLNMPPEQNYTTLGLLSSFSYFTNEQISMLSSVNNFTNVISNSANIPKTTPQGPTNITHRLASQIIVESKDLIQEQTIDYIKTTFPNALAGDTEEESNELTKKCFRDTGFIVESIAADILNNANHRSVETGSFYFSGALLARDFNPDSNVPTLPTNQVQATIAAMVKIGELIIDELVGTAAEVRIPQINLLIDAIKHPLENNGASLSYLPPGTPTTGEQILGNLILQNKETIQREVSGYVFSKKYLSEITPLNQSQILVQKCNRDVGYMVDAIAADLISGVKAKSIQYAVAYWDGSTSRLPEEEIPNQRANTLDTIEKLRSVLLDISVRASTTSNSLLKKVLSLVDTMTFPLQNNGKVQQYNPKGVPTLAELETANSLLSNKQAIQKDVARYVRNQKYLAGNTPQMVEYISKCNRDVGLMIDAVASDLLNGVTSKTIQYALAYWDGSTSRLPEDILPSQIANTLDTIEYLTQSVARTPYAVKCNRDVGFMLDAVISDIENGVIAKSIQYGLAYWDGSTSRLPETEIKNQVSKTLDTVSFLRDRCIELIVSSLGTNSELVSQIFNLAKTVAFPLETKGLSRPYNPPGPPVTAARRDAFRILKKNRSNLQRAIRQEVQALNFLNPVQLDKCTRDVGLMVDAIANDILTGVRSRSIQYGLAYYDGTVARTTRLGVFPSPQVGATANSVLSLGDKIYNLLITERLIPDNNRELFGGINLDYYDSGGFAGENTILPTSVDVDINDNVFVAYSHPLNSFIVKYDNEGNQKLIIALPTNYQAQQLLVDVEGNCWVGVINTNSMLSDDDPQLSQTTPFLNNRIDFVYCFKTGPSVTSPDSDIVTGYFKREYQLVGDFTMDSYGNVWFNTNVNQLNVINSENKPKQYIVGNPASALTFTQDFGGIAGDINNFIWIINNADSKLQILNVVDPFNVDTKDIISFALPGVSFSLAPENQYAYYVTTGDFTGVRWLLKNRQGRSSAGPRIIEGVSNLFSINKPGPFIVKKNENYDLGSKMKSFALQERLATSDILFDEFMGTLLNGNDRTVLELGKIIYERISNFLENHYDVDTCSIESLESLYKMYGFKFKKFFTSLPTTIRRAISLLSINHKKLFGSSNTYNTNFLLSSFYEDPKSNIGKELSITKDRFIIGDPIITYEYFSKKYTLIPNTLIPESDIEIGKPYPLSGVSYDWGWGLVLGSKGQRGVEVGKYYKFFEFLPKDRSSEVFDNIIDFDDDLTTLTPYNSSYNDWIKYAGYLDTAISSMLYEGFELFTSKDKVFDGFIEPIPAPTPTTTPTVTITETPTPTPTPTITDTPQPTKTSFGLVTNLLDKVVDNEFDSRQIATVPYIPQIIYSDIANLVINIEEPFTYVIVQDDISKFTLLFEDVNGIEVENFRDLLNFYNNKLVLTPTDQISANKSELFVTQTCNLSTFKGIYTLYYFNTGSIILGASYVTFALPPLSDYPTPPLRLRKLWNDVVIWDDSDIWYEG